MAASAASEEDLERLRSVASGDARALGELYDLHAGAVMGVCLRVLGDRAEAEEVVADVFMQVWSQAARYDPARGSPLGWIVTIARTRAIDRRRAMGRRPEGEAIEERTWAGGGGPAAPASPELEAEVSQRRERIRGALDALEARQRRAVELAFYDGMSHSEIAAQLGEPLGTVKTRIRTGLMRLRDSLLSIGEEGAAV